MKNLVCRYVWLLWVVWLAACSPQGDYTHVLPKDASVVVSADLKAMAQKGGMDGKEGERLWSKLEGALVSGLEGDARKMLEQIGKKPSESGLSFDDRIYLFVTPQSNAYALLAKVADRAKVAKVLKALEKEQLCQALLEENECMWTQAGDMICAFNEQAFLLVGVPGREALGMKETVFAWLRQDAENSFVRTKEFARMQEAKGEILSVMNMSLLPPELTMQVRMGLSANLKLEDMKYLMATSFEKGQIVVSVETLTENKDLVALYERQSEAALPIKGKFVECFPANTLVWAGGNIVGDRLFDMLCENPTVKQALENPILPIDLEQLFSSMQGDVAFGYTSLSDNDFLLCAEVTDSGFLRLFEELRPLFAMTGGQLRLDSDGADRYELRMYGKSLWFGVKDKMFYLSTDRKLAAEAGRRYGVSVQNMPWAGQITANRFFLSFNAAALMNDLDKHPVLVHRLGGQEALAAWKVLLGPCEYVDLAMPDWRSGQLHIVMKEKDVNVLQLIVRMLEKL